MDWNIVFIFEATTYAIAGCIISHNHRYVSCRNMNLVEVPKRLPQKIRTLDLSGNMIQELHSEAFAKYDELKQLTITKNKLMHVHPNAFRDLKKLILLSLRGNNLNISSANYINNSDL